MTIRTLSELREVELPPWIWQGFLLPAGITLLSASPKVGKTTFVGHLLRAMWTEDQFLGLPIRPAPVLVISEEADTLIAARADALGYSDMWPIGWLTPEPGRTWELTLAFMRRYALLYSNPLIIVDTLSRHWGIDDENDNAKVEKALNPVIAIARTTGASFLLVHHTRKTGGTGGLASRGGSAIVGAVDIVAELRRGERGSPANHRRMETYSRYGETPSNLNLQLIDNVYSRLADDDFGEATGAATDVRKWLLLHAGWWTADSIAALVALPVRTVRDALGQLMFEETITQKGTGRRNSPYQYSATDEVDSILEGDEL